MIRNILILVLIITIIFNFKNICSNITKEHFYSSEVNDYPHPRSRKSILSLARYRGVQSGCNYCEAFKIIRMFNL